MAEQNHGVPQPLQIEAKPVKKDKIARKEVMFIDEQAVVVRDGVDKKFILALREAINMVPKSVREGVIVSMYAEYPDEQAEGYGGGASTQNQRHTFCTNLP